MSTFTNPEVEAVLIKLEAVWGVNYLSIADESNSIFNYKDREIAARLKQVLKQDPSGVIFIGVVRNFVETKLNGTKINYNELAADIKHWEVMASNINELQELLSNGTLAQKLEEQQCYIKNTIKNHISRDLTDKEVSELSVKAPELAADAENYANTLRVFSFTGKANTVAPTRFNNDIIAIRNIDDIYEVATNAPEGISLIAIISHDSHDSHFMILGKSGNKSVVYMDHNQKIGYSTGLRTNIPAIRKLGDELLPFELFNTAKFPFSHDPSNELKVYDQDYKAVFPLTSISELPALKVFSIILLFQRVSDNWRSSDKAPMIFTGDRIQIESNENKLPTIYKKHIVSVPVNSIKDMTYSKLQSVSLSAGYHIMHETNRNNYFEDIFAPAISHIELLGQEHIRLEYEGSEINIKLTQPKTKYLGTMQESLAEIAFIARNNQAIIIRSLVLKDYQNNYKKMKLFIREQSISNGLIFDIMAKNIDKLPAIGSDQIQFAIDSNSACSTELQNRDHSINRHFLVSGLVTNNPNSEFIPAYSLKDEGGRFTAVCPITEQKADLFLTISLRNALDISCITGVHIKDLPHSMNRIGFKRDVGNENLQRVDPMESMPTPYTGCHFKLSLAVSIKGFNLLREERGLDKIKKIDLTTTNTFPRR